MRLKLTQVKSGIIELYQSFLFCFQASWSSSKIYTLVRLGLVMLIPLCSIGNSYIAKMILDALNLSRDLFAIVSLLLTYGVLSVCLTVSDKISTYISSMHEEHIGNIIRMKVMNVTLNSGIQLFDDSDTHDKISFAASNIHTVSRMLWGLIDLLSAAISIIATFTIMFGYNPLYALLLLFASIPSAISASRYTKALFKLSLSQVNEERKKEYIYNVSTDRRYASDIRLNHLQTYLLSKYSNIWTILFSKRKQKVRARTIITTIFQILPELIGIGVLMHITLLILQGVHTVGDFMFFSSISTQFIVAINSSVSLFVMLYDNRLRLNALQELQNLHLSPPEHGSKRLNGIDAISFHHVCFRYPGSNNLVLNDVSFEINSGEKVAFVGINGAGKSTVIKLLLGFYKPTSGLISVNGHCISEYRSEDLHRHFSTYFQNAVNYSFTLRENIGMTYPIEHIDENRMANSFLAAGLNNTLSEIPHGFDTFLTRKFDPSGIVLSEGQEQKVALARVIYKNSEFIILDEPSAALDPEAESVLFKRLNQIGNNKTMLFTSHRLSNISMATRILVIENGVVLEDGSLKALLESKGRFYELYQYQADKYRDSTRLAT